jgi:hypothetical protein
VRQQGQPYQLTCGCGNPGAAACVHRCCGICCKKVGGCQRHKVAY